MFPVKDTDKEKIAEYLEKYKQLPLKYDLFDKEANYPIFVDDIKNINCVVIEYKKNFYYGVFGTDEKALTDAYEQFLTDKRVWVDACDTRVFEVYKKYGFVYEEVCNMYEYTGKPVKLENCPYKLSTVKVKDYKIVKSKYAYPVTLKEITYCGKNFPTSAIYDGDTLVCWCMIHRNGAIGPIYTLPQYRGKNLAVYVTNDIVAKMLQKNMRPYLLIIIGNTASENLSKKIGFNANGAQVGWGYKK
ncbi:MAG TPA: GNAT family N-acetyltransferase [Eubacteriales bacterium]|mgnify:CR=1 FL=1|nr:GNAT family N-acetyltransferase [Eubacteriales bacterium]